MTKLLDWHQKHVSARGKKRIWLEHWAPEFEWERTSMFRQVRFINKVNLEAPGAFLRFLNNCAANNTAPTLAAAKEDQVILEILKTIK